MIVKSIGIKNQIQEVVRYCMTREDEDASQANPDPRQSMLVPHQAALSDSSKPDA